MLKEITAKTMLHFHEREFATHWDANIYRGCGHHCSYCFAQYSHKYLKSDDFFNDIHVKSNAAELLYMELGKAKWDKSPVSVCGVSDCYQPAEAKYKIMPKVIESFIKRKNPLVITTKSKLILRDFELIKKLHNITDVVVATSVSTLDEGKRKLIEPAASPTIERLKMLKKFKDIGCHTVVLFLPIMPFISDEQENLEGIFKLTKEYGLDSIIAGPLHLRGNTKKVFYSFLETNYSQLLAEYKQLYKSGSASKEYRYNLKQRIKLLREKYQLYYTPQPYVSKIKKA